MKDINNCQTKFESCQYSDRLIDKLLLLNKVVKDQVDIQEVKKAIYYARKYHGSQMRKSGEPYYSHPLAVAYMVADHIMTRYRRNKPNFVTVNAIITAILHDTIEDTSLTYEEIKKEFGEKVERMVEGLTRIKLDKKISSAEILKILYKQNDKETITVKLYDRLHNLQTMESMSKEKQEENIKETLTEFLILALYLEMDDVFQEVTEISQKFTQKHFSHKQLGLPFWKDQDILSLIYQNDTNHK